MDSFQIAILYNFIANDVLGERGCGFSLFYQKQLMFSKKHLSAFRVFNDC